SLIELLEKRGVNFTDSDITSNGFIERKPTNKRKKRKNTTTDLDRLAWQQVKRPKKVKPGYRQQMKNQQEAIKRSVVQQKNKQKRSKKAKTGYKKKMKKQQEASKLSLVQQKNKRRKK